MKFKLHETYSSNLNNPDFKHKFKKDDGIKPINNKFKYKKATKIEFKEDPMISRIAALEQLISEQTIEINKLKSKEK